MAKNYTYYYQFDEPGNQYSPGVYRTQYPNSLMLSLATRVWTQGPRGGVRIVAEDYVLPPEKCYGHGYKTQNPLVMKEFAWVKLTAKNHL